MDCKNCHKPGHNIRTCPDLKKLDPTNNKSDVDDDIEKKNWSNKLLRLFN